jgi:NAD-dependent dihydropyrimidine dehydrogenase PreA subunit/flavodoxin
LEINKVTTIYFSPTGTGKKIVNEIATSLPYEQESIDLTLPEPKQKSYHIESNVLAIISVPVYGGRVPQTASNRLKNIHGNNTFSVIVVMYGNRAYEDALLELKNILSERSFKTIAGAAFIGQHSYSTVETPIAQGRPDSLDLKKAQELGLSVLKKVHSKQLPDELTIPGNYPYQERGKREPKSPETYESTCILCGACERACPTRCILVSNLVETQKEKCISCTACVQTCPTGSRQWTHEGVIRGAKWLSIHFGERKEPDVFL